MFWAAPGNAFAQANGAAASATPAADGAAQYAVKPGQSLSDIAGELTGSKDRDVRARAARALFEANPNAFANHDINKLKLGSVLSVPPELGGVAASAPASASASAEAQNAAVESSAASDASAPSSESATAAAPASAVEPVASAPQDVASAPAQTAETASAPVTTASAPASTAPAPEKSGGMSPVIIGIAIAVIAGLFLMRRRGKRNDAKRADDDASPRTYASLEEAQAEAAARNGSLAKGQAASAAGAGAVAVAAADLGGKSTGRSTSEPDATAPAVENADTVPARMTPSDDELPPTIEAPATPEPSSTEAQAEPLRPVEDAKPFAPISPAARHPDFVPPLPGAAEPNARQADQTTGPAAEKWEAEEREAAARRAAAQEALEREEREERAREAAARETLARDAANRQAEMREVTGREEQAREAAAREIVAHEAELRELKARTADEQDPDDEPSIAHSFPMPKFPQEAVQALDSLDMDLPPRMELKLAEPANDALPAPASQTPEAPLEAPPAEPLDDAQPIEQAPFLPQPVAENPPQPADTEAKQPQSVAAQIEAGTAGAASVAGLGATRFGPLSLDFDLGPTSSATEPLPALTPAQLATIARNKLELAAEYIELGDLQGARTLLQEVIESNDPATRQQAATLLSTLAPHS
ncbi:putative uncharacterized protein [Caballeronia insecticola]|uniref:Transmembrane protein n=1 Tax=Caballeronia insecticola TaxID=758793 RepID=R4WXI2_9BURK|nr:putative uncharacterized protein [Caballeronia insecticola]